MPHLSPMNWLAVSLILWIIMSLSMSLIWWTQSPIFLKPASMKTSQSMLPWN